MVAVTYVRDIGTSRATTVRCQVGDIGGAPCGKRAEVKLADAAGTRSGHAWPTPTRSW
jgi:hypothetical protein